MIKSSTLRVTPSANGISIWSADIFGSPEAARLRTFLTRAFSVPEVEDIELRRAASFGRIRYAAAGDPSGIWKRLGRALRGQGDAGSDAEQAIERFRAVDADQVYLGAEPARSIRVSRIGDVLTTWRVSERSEGRLRLWHPFLRNRRDVVFRLEEELGAILGIEDFHASVLTGRVSIRFDAQSLTLDHLARELEKAWPRLVDGLEGPPSRTRFVAAAGLLGLAAAGQYVTPAVRPIALAGMTLYSSPNVVSAAKQLTRGEVGLSALYSTGLAFMLIGGSPFVAAIFATLMQFWPELGRSKLVRSQRRLFRGQRRLPLWARLAHPEQGELEVSVHALRGEDRVVVRGGDILPVDGIIESGYASIVGQPPIGPGQTRDVSKGDLVSAGAYVRDGRLTVRVVSAGEQTTASYLSSLLPHATLAALPSAQEAERIANRNAKPALTLSALGLLLTRTLRIAQATIRPDYATGPRLSAQLSALRGIAHGLQQGVLFRNVAALDRLAAIDTYVIDDSAELARRGVEVAQLQTVSGVSSEQVGLYASTASLGLQSEQGAALRSLVARSRREAPKALVQQAGVIRYRDDDGSLIELATTPYLSAWEIEIPEGLQTSPARRGKKSRPKEDVQRGHFLADPALRPLWVLRNSTVIGGVTFARSGEPAGAKLVHALRAQSPSVRIVYVAPEGDAKAHVLAAALGVQHVQRGAGQLASSDLIRGLGGSTLWIGDGSLPAAREAMAASTVSASVAPLSRARDDAADVLLPVDGLAALPALMELAHAHARRLQRDYRAVYATNLLAVAGGLFARATSLQAGLMSHFATGLIYARHARGLDRLARHAETKREHLERLLPQ
jgi:cation-transporting P-type ATPase C